MHKVFQYKISGYSDKRLSEAIEEYFCRSDAAKRLNEQSRVLIKPNLVAKHGPAAAVTTHPAVVREIIKALKKRGVKHIIIADSPGGVYRAELMKAIYEVSGLADVCREEGAELYTACRYYERKTEGRLCKSFNLIEPVHSSNFIINVPKLKTHMMMNLSCAVKNLFGCIPGLQKAELHMRFPEKEHFSAMLCDLYETVKPDMNIADGILSMEGNGPAGGVPRKSEILLASDSAPLLDLTACRIIGFDIGEVMYLSELSRRGLCPEALSSEMLCGDSLPPIPDFMHPTGSGSINFSHKLPKALSWVMPLVQNFTAPRPSIKASVCIGCGKCAEICPAGVIQIKNRRACISRSNCIRCFCCHEVCPVKAIDVKRSRFFKA